MIEWKSALPGESEIYFLTHPVHPNFCSVYFCCYTRFIVVLNFCNMSFVVGTR